MSEATKKLCGHPSDVVCSACPQAARTAEEIAESRQAACEIGAMWASEERAYAERCRDLADKWARDARRDAERAS